MTDWPTAPAPSEVSAPQFLDPSLQFTVDQGYVARRSRWSRGKRRYTLLYKLVTRNDRVLLDDFVERVIRVDGATFGWTNPVGLTVSGASNAAPIVITTAANHGYQTNDTVVVANVTGNTAANGTWTITRVSATTFSLNGSSGNGTYASGGTAAIRFASMALADISAAGLANLETAWGPDQDDDGRWTLTYTFEEKF